MKYNELKRKLLAAGCYPLQRQVAGHPLWYSPITGKEFITSNHGKNEVAKGTLKQILKDSGIKL